MRAPIPICLALIALRELTRAAIFPLRCLLYLPQHNRWKRSTRETLAARSGPSETDAIHRFLELRQPLHGSHPHVLLSCGEASGEAHATSLIRASKSGGLDARWSCFGGPSMQREGGELVFPLSEHAIMGVAGVLRAMPFIFRAVARYLRLLRTDPPDLVVLVDYPGLHVIMGRLARRHGIPVLHYIAPQYWGWAPWRLTRYRHCVDANLTILPYENVFYERYGIPSEYVGHPLLDHLIAHAPDPDMVEAIRARPTVCLLPGSRRSELNANIPPFVAIAKRLRDDQPDLRFVLPHVDERRAPLIRSLLNNHDADFIEFHPGPLASWLEGARVVLAKSGTGSLEACVQGTPTVVVYRIKSRFGDWAYRKFITVPWVAAANLIAGRRVVPEFVFCDDDTWRHAEQALRELMADGEARDECLAGLVEMRAAMGQAGASERAAQWLLAFFDAGS